MTKEEILEKLKRDTIIRGLSKNTQLKQNLFQDHYDKPATELNVNDIKNYLYYLLTEKAPGSHSSGHLQTRLSRKSLAKIFQDARNVGRPNSDDV